jgi:hypothetical protein
MYPQQGETGQTMVKGGLFPGLFIMAFFTGFAFLPFVHIIFRMAGVTTHPCGLELLIGVTIHTFEGPMFALEGETGLAIMIKGRGLPGFFVMTVCTTGP